MAKKVEDYSPAFFGQVPNRTVVDSRLTGTAFRLLNLYAFHDRNSIMRGKGDGCKASNKTLCARLGCDYTTLIKLRADLRSWGYIHLSPRPTGKRLEIVRVIPDHLTDPNCWPFDQCYIGFKALETWGVAPEKVGEIANNWIANAGELANFVSEKVGERISETNGNSPKTEQQYIPRRGETYSSEEGEDNSTKWRDSEIANEKSSAQAGLGRDSLRALMPPSFDRLDSPAMVAQIERAFGKLDRDPDRIAPAEREEIKALLWSIHDTYAELDFGQQAWRLHEEFY